MIDTTRARIPMNMARSHPTGNWISSTICWEIRSDAHSSPTGQGDMTCRGPSAQTLPVALSAANLASDSHLILAQPVASRTCAG